MALFDSFLSLDGSSIPSNFVFCRVGSSAGALSSLSEFSATSSIGFFSCWSPDVALPFAFIVLPRMSATSFTEESANVFRVDIGEQR
eukprot:XP_001708630.1 Hypothetical protein GL50803_32310 [Giardia lamblia ATCC 50803]